MKSYFKCNWDNYDKWVREIGSNKRDIKDLSNYHTTEEKFKKGFGIDIKRFKIQVKSLDTVQFDLIEFDEWISKKIKHIEYGVSLHDAIRYVYGLHAVNLIRELIEYEF